jgi:GTP-binding protein EngB required for normal cell division
MLGDTEVGKTHLTNQFMSSSDVGTYNQLTGKTRIVYFFGVPSC